MSWLWEPRANYREDEPQSLSNPPYVRFYTTLNPEELEELLQDAKRLRWEVLDLRGCGLSDIPDTLGELEDLRILSLNNLVNKRERKEHSFTKLPDSIGCLSNLQELDLSITRISTLPDSIGNLKNLQVLDLSKAPIKVLPDSIGNLSNLQALNLSRVPISVLPDSIGNLSNLEALELSETQISALPDSIGSLSNLQELYLSDTQIRTLPDSIGNLKNLEELDLSGTQIRTLPDSIRNLSNLNNLGLCACHLQAIPYSVVALKLPFVINDSSADNCINLTGVTLDEGDISLFAQSREVIEDYYREQAEEGVNECKVIFLGDGAAGKSSLIERIVNGTFEPGSLPTDGVKMTKWLTIVDSNPFILRFLDFGGQEIMHSMHRCFLTAHTVYVIVCESRDDPEIDAIATRWLETVKAFAPDCPVILALNKCDVNPNVSVNERDLRERNPKLKCVLKTSAKEEPGHKFGVNRLLAEIMEEVPRCVSRITANRHMLAVKKELENMTEDYIYSERYRAICTEHHIDEEKLQYQWLNYFKDLGVAYSYDPSAESDDIDTRLESIRVLNPAWLTNGIYRLILRTEENGFLPIKTIQKTLRATHAGDILRDKTYSKAETEFILHVMRKFEISHYIGGGVEMIPLKMPKTPPPTVDDFNKRNALHLRWEGAYLPNNLIHRLLIRKFPELDRACVWRTGGHFTQEGGGCEALAEMNEKALNVYVNGERAHCRSYLETFRRVIQAILTDLNLKAKEVICCTVDGQEGYIPYEDAVQQYYDKRESIYIPGIRKYVNPAELLRDTYYNWEQEAANYRQRMEYIPFRIAEPLPDKLTEPPEKADNSLEEEKTRAEIAQIHAETKKSKAEEVQIKAETEKTHVEIQKMNLGIKGAVAAVLLLAFLIWAFPDTRHELVETLITLLSGLL